MLTTDVHLQMLCPPLTDEEYAHLEASLLAEGCRDPLVVWPRHGALVLLDGHNRYRICQAHGLPYLLTEVPLASQEAAVNWVIDNQLGRRNLSEEQKSYLRGKRYNLEKKAEGRPGKLPHCEGETGQRLAQEYGVGRATIERDGEFAQAVDVLATNVSPDMRDAALKRQNGSAPRLTKKQVTQAGKLVQERTVEPLPFMRREGWKPHQLLEAIDHLAALPQDEHARIDALLNRPGLPPGDALTMLANLHVRAIEQRLHCYGLAESADPRERSLADTLLAEKAPEPDPQAVLAGNLIRAVEEIRDRQRRNWRRPYAYEPWAPRLDEIDQWLANAQDAWRVIARAAEQHHKERIAAHVEALLPHQ
jgi:hypothetical protein